jgi:hypothetical protein
MDEKESIAAANELIGAVILRAVSKEGCATGMEDRTSAWTVPATQKARVHLLLGAQVVTRPRTWQHYLRPSMAFVGGDAAWSDAPGHPADYGRIFLLPTSDGVRLEPGDTKYLRVPRQPDKGAQVEDVLECLEIAWRTLKKP